MQGFFRITVLFDDATGEAGHGGIAAAFHDELCTAVGTTGHIRIEVICGQVFA